MDAVVIGLLAGFIRIAYSGRFLGLSMLICLFCGIIALGLPEEIFKPEYSACPWSKWYSPQWFYTAFSDCGVHCLFQCLLPDISICRMGSPAPAFPDNGHEPDCRCGVVLFNEKIRTL